MQTSLQLFAATDGNLSAKVVFEDNVVRHLHSTVKPEAEADLYDNFQWYGDLIVFAGIGLGWHVKKILSRLPAHASCIVIDYFEKCVTHAEETVFAGVPNRKFFISADASEEKKNALSAFIRNARPGSLQILKHPASFDCFREYYETLLDAISRQFVMPRKRHTEIAKRALVFFGDFFLEEEVRRALIANAIEPVLFEYKKQSHGIDFETALLRQIQNEKPDFILSINMKGFDGNGETGRMAQRLGVPLIVWFVDDPRPILLSSKTHVRPEMTAFCWEKEYCQLLRDAGFAKAEYLPLACDPELFSKTSQPPPKVTTQVGFVGTSMVDRFAGNIRDKFLWSDSLIPLVEDMSDTLRANPAFPVYGSIPVHAKRLGIPLAFSDERNLTWLGAYIIHHASMKKRKTIISGLLSMGIETFGDPEGWKELINGTITTHPNIDYRRQLASVYQKIAINVNITSCQMPTAINQRVFDVPTAGGFVISDKQKDMYELFEPREIVVYESAEDLREKVRFYLAHETERRGITGRAQKRILGEHTYALRIKKIISSLRRSAGISRKG